MARPSTLSVLGVAALLLTGLATWLVWGRPAPDGQPVAAPPSVRLSDPPRSVTQAAAAPAAAASAPPARILIPSIGVDAPVTPVGLDRNRALELPPLSEPNLAGWYDQSPRPGQAGPSVIAGHVDSTTGPSVFFNVKNLRPGDKIAVRDAGRRTHTYRVQWIQEASKSAFPTKAVYGDVPYPALRLITCGGPFDAATGHYLDNIVVYAAAA
jgi:LPXTG-site transpeptidase (sortase) family protein